MAVKKLTVDMHCHPALKTWLFDRNLEEVHKKESREFDPFSMRVDLNKMQAGNVDVIMSALLLIEAEFIRDCKLLNLVYGPIQLVWGPIKEKIEKSESPNTAFNQTLEILRHFEDKIERAKAINKSLGIARSYNELIGLLNDRKKVILHTLEGAHSLGRAIGGKKPDYKKHLKTFFDKGVCMMTLGHFYQNDIVAPVEAVPPSMRRLLHCHQTKDLTKGLTKMGESIVEEMLEMGIIVDLTHSTPKAREKVFEINDARGTKKRPLVFSHVGVQRYFKNPMNPTDQEIKKIQDCKGVIGNIFYNYWLVGREEKDIPFIPDFTPEKGLEHILKTVEHIRRITGTFDNIAIGSDLDGFTDPPDDLFDISKMKYLRTRLENKHQWGYVNQIMGGNALRVLKEGWGDPQRNTALPK